MTDKDKTPNVQPETVVEHPQLKRDKAFALFLARSHARNHGEPLPDPATIGLAAFTRLTPEMSEEQMLENLIATLERSGIEVKRDKKISKDEISHD